MRVFLGGRVPALVSLLVLGGAWACSSAQSDVGGELAGAGGSVAASGAGAGAGGVLAASGAGTANAGAPGAAGSLTGGGASGAGGTALGGGPSNGGSSGASAGTAGSAGSTAGHGGSSAGAAGSSAGAGGAAGAGVGGASGTAGSAGGGAMPNITVWIAGDSTVATGGPCPIGWGGQIKALFNTKVTVTNSAVGGRSVRTWLYDVLDTKDTTGECNLGKDATGNVTMQSRWTAMLNGMKAGDYLLIQFGINDSDSACPRHVGTAAFKTTYGMMAQAAKDRGAHPVFVTPVSNIACSGSTVSTNTREPFVTATKDAGTQYAVPVIDLNALSTALYKTLGFCPIPGGGDVSASTTGAVGTFFCNDHTHFDQTGAAQIAGLVAKGLSAGNIGLAAYLK